jgi:hypothetical protein
MRPIKVAFNWAAKRNEFAGRLTRNPLAGMVIPRGEPRKHYTSDDEWAVVKAGAKGTFRDFLLVSESSGA